jgi:hypothetical protein
MLAGKVLRFSMKMMFAPASGLTRSLAAPELRCRQQASIFVRKALLVRPEISNDANASFKIGG